MKPAHHAAAPTWPPTLESYDYLSSLVARDWAWEGLRRNESYQAEVLSHAATANVTEHLEGEALVTRMQEPAFPAHAWVLCTFRGPVADRSAGPSRVAARRRRVDAHGRHRAGLRFKQGE
jgi:transcriptional regulator